MNAEPVPAPGRIPPSVRAGTAYLRCATGLLPGQQATARALDRYLTRHPVTAVARTRFGVGIPAASSDLIQRYLLMFGTWEPNLTHWIKRRLRPGDTFIDVGSNIGYYTLLAATLAGPRGQAIAIEPSPAFCGQLAGTARACGLGQVRVIQAGVSDAAGPVAFYQPEPGNLGHTTAVPPRIPARPAFAADAAPLPALLRPGDLAAARVIKIDVEGAEAAAVTGLVPQLGLLRHDTELVIEVSPRLLRRQGRDLAEITEPLALHRWTPYLLANDYSAASYPRAIRRPRPLRRLKPPFAGLPDPTDLIFSRTDSDYL